MAYIIEKPSWIFYVKEKVLSPIHNVGKWMYFWENNAQSLEFVKMLCNKAIDENICTLCKHTNPAIAKFIPHNTGVICFYIDGADKKAHKKVLEFFLKNNLIPRTKKGLLKNIAFKFDEQTLAKEYGDSFKAKISLSDFVDLKTGDFID